MKQVALFGRKITERKILQVLVAGFVLIILMMLMAALAGLRSLELIQASAQQLGTELRVTSSLIVQIQNQLTTLNAVTGRLSRDPEVFDEEAITKLLAEAEKGVSALVREGRGTFEAELWQELESASAAYTAEARAILRLEPPRFSRSRAIFRRNGDFVSAAVGLIQLSSRRATQAQARIESQMQRLIRETVYVVGGCLLLAVFLGMATLKLAARLIRRMEAQASDLGRVSWHLLESQETTARRFSHELHDELGQSLTAVKANLSMLSGAAAGDREKIADCVNLVEGAIENVREMSQLLHPHLLDDFGLDAALSAYAEKFSQRTGIQAEYESNLNTRLPAQTSTHVFRIAQEALTNVARHSRASRVHIQLTHEAARLRLRVSDNGRGMASPGRRRATRGLGLIAMGARARNLGGDLEIGESVEGGVLIEAEVPVGSQTNGQENTDTVGR